MIQRVGLAQALVNDPELVILDEPMSGLDPLGRREVRELILELRDQGRTILFSSHILSDAELLCSRVGILSRGRLVTSGSLADLTGGDAAAGRGWEVVMSGVPASVVTSLAGRVRRATPIADGRFTFELSETMRPESLIAELASAGASLVSVSPLRTTLEDVFVAATGQTPVAAGSGPQAGAEPRPVSTTLDR
jgi:ABC-2 type transport system ATP-binding protein